MNFLKKTLFAILVLPLGLVEANADDLNIILERCDQQVLAEAKTANATDIANWEKTLRVDGRWPDIDYTDKSRTQWQPLKHLARLAALADTWRNGGDPSVRATALAAYTGWAQGACPTSDNWYFGEIFGPLLYARSTVLLRSDLSTEQLSAGVSRLDLTWQNISVDTQRYRGANLMWRIRTMIYRSAVTHDENLMRAAMKMLGTVLCVSTNAEYIQPDLSFHQHGHLLYNGGYGADLISDCVSVFALCQGTRFMPPTSQVDLLSHFMLDANCLMTRGDNYDYSVLGREIVRPNRSADALAADCRAMAEINPARAADFLGYAKQIEIGSGRHVSRTGDRQFWRSDYHLQQRPDFLATVKCCSTRTIAAEVNNGENWLGYYLGDGVNFIYRRGDEYQDIFPVWDWCRLPGVTARLAAGPPKIATSQQPKFGSLGGTTEFVGGASDGEFGVCTMEFSRNGVSGLKSWFFFDHEFVCLGAGISARAGEPVVTTVNQCLRQGTITVQCEGKANTIFPDGEQCLSNTAWIHHDGIGYLFPDSTVHLRSQTQSGNWNRLTAPPNSYSKTDVALHVLTLWLDHGRHPAETSYAYTVVPGVSVAGLAAYAAQSRTEIITNTSSIQAVRQRASGIVEATFRVAGSIQILDAGTLSVDQPCALVFHPESDKLLLTAASPLAKGVQIHCVITHVDGGTTTEVNFDLPSSSEDAGRSVSIILPPSKK